ncbi:MAG: twin-arginine translocation signal domain-containing protein, partial [Anaerolineae bacterium]|nr:twin-arginine translocation signal domain-containing protein [Anaerolineae bacterium]
MSLSRRSFLKLVGVGAGGLAAASAASRPATAATAATDASGHPSMLYDTTLCVGCRACQTACRTWNETKAERDPQRLYDAPDDLSADTWTVIQLYVDPENPTPQRDRSNWSFIKRNCMH